MMWLKSNQTKSNITSLFNDGFLFFDQKVLPLSAPLDEPGILGHIHLLTLFKENINLMDIPK